jgi:hypothetical protein
MDNMKGYFVLGVLLVVLSACAPTRPDMVVQNSPFTAQDKVILIEPFDFSPAIATGVDPSAVKDFGNALADDIEKYLKKTGFDRAIVITQGEKASGDFLIRGRISRVDGGNLFHRYFFELFGFGATEVSATGEVLDAQSWQSLAGFSFTRQSPWTWLKNEEAVRQNLSEIGNAIAQMLIQNRQ